MCDFCKGLWLGGYRHWRCAPGRRTSQGRFLVSFGTDRTCWHLLREPRAYFDVRWWEGLIL